MTKSINLNSYRIRGNNLKKKVIRIMSYYYEEIFSTVDLGLADTF